MENKDFARLIGAADHGQLKADRLFTPLGELIAIADEEGLYFLEFLDCRGLALDIDRFKKKVKSAITIGRTKALNLIEKELRRYFEGTLKEFKTPAILSGTDFQNQVWEELKKIPYSHTRSYSDIAVAIDKPTAYRAVAQANAVNHQSIIIPCHRVINSNGDIGGYGRGISRKKWLLNHEKHYQG